MWVLKLLAKKKRYTHLEVASVIEVDAASTLCRTIKKTARRPVFIQVYEHAYSDPTL